MKSLKKSTGSSSGVSILGLLGVMFVGLKLTEVIAWSWWWVLLPFYGGLALILGLGALALLAAGGLKGITKLKRK